MATAPTESQSALPVTEVPVSQQRQLRIYSHTMLFYWWPVWLSGFILAIVTRLGGSKIEIGGFDVWMHPSKNLGLFFGVILFLVILITNVTVRGMASLIVILSGLCITVLFAYLGWWEVILQWIPHLAVFINLGFYLFLSIPLFVVWAVSVFVYDHMTYWSFRPGQITRISVIGSEEKSYDTRGMLLEKVQNDLFRHKVLGLGSGDIRIMTTGARPEEIVIPNVLFVGRQIREMQQFIATKPNEEVGAIHTS